MRRFCKNNNNNNKDLKPLTGAADTAGFWGPWGHLQWSAVEIVRMLAAKTNILPFFGGMHPNAGSHHFSLIDVTALLALFLQGNPKVLPLVSYLNANTTKHFGEKKRQRLRKTWKVVLSFFQDFWLSQRSWSKAGPWTRRARRRYVYACASLPEAIFCVSFMFNQFKSLINILITVHADG